jgi:hypothetical protein
MIALGEGAKQSVRDRIAKLGTTALQIDAQWVRTNGIQTNVRKRVTIDDVKAINERAPHVLAVEPQQDKDLQLQWASKNASVKVVGATPNFLDVQHFQIERGRVFTSGEDIGRQRVVVLGSGVLTMLGVPYPEAIIGQAVRIGGMQFEVIGTLRSKGAGAGFGSPDDQTSFRSARVVSTVRPTGSMTSSRSPKAKPCSPTRPPKSRSRCAVPTVSARDSRTTFAFAIRQTCSPLSEPRPRCLPVCSPASRR